MVRPAAVVDSPAVAVGIPTAAVGDPEVAQADRVARRSPPLNIESRPLAFSRSWGLADFSSKLISVTAA